MTLKQLDVFREKLDDVMCRCIGKRIAMYGYNRTSRFIKWYAKYYHNIDTDYIIDPDGSSGKSFEHGFFAPTVFDYNYKDIKSCVLWMTEVVEDKHKEYVEKYGFVKNETWFDFYEIIYDGDYESRSDETNPFNRKKTGRRDIQFLEYLEWKHDCNFVEFVGNAQYTDNNENLSHGAPYKLATQPELFPVLDQLRRCITEEDAIFDFGCGKGGAMVALMDYGFRHVGGVEYETGLYNVLEDNINKLDLRSNYEVETFCCDAALLTTELDKYNYFYFFNPFDITICKQVINAICDSIDRCDRKVTIIQLYPTSWQCVMETGRFRLVAQMDVNLYQRVVDIFESV